MGTCKPPLILATTLALQRVKIALETAGRCDRVLGIGVVDKWSSATRSDVYCVIEAGNIGFYLGRLEISENTPLPDLVTSERPIADLE